MAHGYCEVAKLAHETDQGRLEALPHSTGELPCYAEHSNGQTGLVSIVIMHLCASAAVRAVSSAS
jgi:hypothetical protein